MSQPPKIDATDPAAVVKEIFDDDKWVKEEFSKTLSAEILNFAETLAQSFKQFPELDKLAAADEQAAFVTGFIYGTFDDLITSMKLLASGKLMASGNLMRQAIEGVALAILCAAREPVFIGKKVGGPIKYWLHVKRDDPRIAAHRSLDHLQLNAKTLGLSVTAVQELKKARSHFHQFSHPGMMGIASRVDLGEPGPIFLGGSFDKSKLPAYRIEIEHRIGLCAALPNLIGQLILRLRK